MTIKINKMLGTTNRTKKTRTKKTIEYIVIHYVGALGDAKANAQFYASTYAGASADFYVGHTGDIWQGNDYFSGYSWHCGGGRQSSSGGTYYKKCTNANSIGIEMCVKNDGDTSAPNSNWYFLDATVEATVELVKYLMAELDIDADHVIRHYDVNGKLCPAPYLDEFHKGAWDAFKEKISGNEQLYRVRRSWDDAASQIGAYESLENAKAACKAGYTVYDKDGATVYSAPATEGTQATDLTGLTEAAFVCTVAPLFTADQKKTGILASLSLAQMILESGWCSTELAKNANNCFGMKTELSGNDWKDSTWDGKSTYTKKTEEQDVNGNEYTVTAKFRKYSCVEDSIADHSAYLAGAQNGTALRYNGLKGCTDYKKAAQIVKDGGYATDTKYVEKLCALIEKYGLEKYNAESTEVSGNEEFTPYKVKVSSDVLRIRKGPGTDYEAVGYTGKGTFTIVKEQDGWGYLKSGAGWICLTVSCVKKM